MLPFLLRMKKAKPHIRNVVWRSGWAHLRIRVDGREIWRSLRTRYASEARRRVAELSRDILAGQDYLATRRRLKLSVRQLVDRYLEGRGSELKPHTKADHKQRLNAFVAWVAGRHISQVAAVSAQAIMDYRIHRLKELKRAPATVRSDLSSVRAAFTFAWRMGWIVENPFDRLPRAPQVARVERKILSWRPLEKFLGAQKAPLHDILWVAALSGLRAGELANLRHEDIDRRRGLIYVVNRPPEFTIKTYQARTLPLGARLAKVLPRRKRGRLWPKDLSRNVLCQRATAAFKDAGMPVGLHLLRHTWITYLLLCGCPVVKVMAWAGHSNMSTTQGYTHVRQRIAQAEIDAFRKALGKPFGLL